MQHTEDKPEQFLTLRKVADRLDCTRSHVRRMIAAGRLKAINIAVSERRAEWRVAPAALEDFIRQESEASASRGVLPRPGRAS